LILAKHFAVEFCKENKKNNKTISEEAKNKLIAYHYPGNIRELKAIVELAIVMSDSDEITAKDITFNSTTTFRDFIHEECTLKAYHSKIIKHYLDKYDNDIALTATRLDIGKSTIYRMLQNGEL
jgi:DNA-binding NtrC family response regulator